MPDENLVILKLLYNIEVALREFIIDALGNEFGPLWWKERIPSDIKDIALQGLRDEITSKRIKLIPHHPVYYIDFAELLIIIIEKDNWEEVFKLKFRREEIIFTILSEIENIRNNVAHNRRATKEDVTIVQSIYEKTVSSIGEERFSDFTARTTYAENIRADLSSLRELLKNTYNLCLSHEQVTELDTWEAIKNTWWFDPEYLDAEITSIKEYFRSINFYKKLSIDGGADYVIETWIKENNLKNKYEDAIKEFLKIDEYFK